jgi:hypothetical protein
MQRPTIAALAGRRVDAAGAADARFPLANVASVRAQIAAVLRGIMWPGWSLRRRAART